VRRIVRQEDGEDVATTAGALATRVFRSAPARRRCESFLCKPILLQKRRAGSSYVGDVGVVRAQESHGIPTRNHKESRRGIQHDEPRNARNRRISRENPTSKCLRRSLEQLLCIRPSLPQPPVGGPGSPELVLDDLEARSTLPGAACSMSQEPYDLTQQVSQPTTVP